MLNSVLFGTYAVSAGAIIYNIASQKMKDDVQRDIKEYREYDFINEKMKKESFENGKELKCIILAKYFKPLDQKQIEEEESTEQPQDEEMKEQILFSKKIAVFNIMDPARLFKHKIKSGEEFTMLFDKSEKNNEPIEVHF